MSVPFKIVYLIKDGETGENLIQTDELLELNAIDGSKLVDNSVPSAKLNAIDGEKIMDNSIPISKIIKGADIIYHITNSPPPSLKLGMAVYWAGTNYLPASGENLNKIPTAVVIELNEYNYSVQYAGIFSMSNNNWDQITDQTGGLIAIENQNKYFLSNLEDGYITNISPPLSVPIYNCIKNDGTVSTVEVKFGILYSNPVFDSLSQEREIFIGDGLQDTFELAKTPYSRDTTSVTINGTVIQNNGFSIVDKNIIFSVIPESEYEIEIKYITQSNLNYANIVKHTETATVEKTQFNLPVNPSSEDNIMAWISGVYQDNTAFTISGNTITFNENVTVGAKVQFLIFKEVQFADLSYIKRKTLTIGNNATKTLINAFGEQSSARYDFHVMANPLISGLIRLQETNPINVRIETLSTSITLTHGNVGKLNVYINDDGKLEFQNKLGNTITLVIEKHQ